VFPFAQVAEALCSLAAFVYLRGQTDYWKGFLFFLPFTVAVETVGLLIAKLLHQSNHWLYNIYLPVQFLFTGYVLYQVFPYPKKKKWFLVGLLLFTLIYVVESFWGRYTYNSISDTLSSFMLVCGSGFYYYFLLYSEEYVTLARFAPFWFVTGVFLFNFGITASNLFSEDMMHLYITKNLSLRYVIFFGLTLLLYSCWVYAFRCKSQENISSY
jgi:hypothetical protein